jgi:rRNA methylases
LKTLITSPSNARISKLQTLHTTRGRKKSGLFLLEGPHLLETLLEAHLWPVEVFYHPALLERTPEGRTLLARLLATAEQEASQMQLIEVGERVIEALGEVQTSQGVVSVLPQQSLAYQRLLAQRPQQERPCLLILDDLADPGNMGTVLRTALAANVERVLLTPHCVDYFSPKVVRAAAGAHVALVVERDLSWEAIAERVTRHCGGERRVFVAEAGSDELYFAQDLRQPFALIVGNEAHGPSAQAHALATHAISIPQANNVESLNAAMATGIILYECVRQVYQKAQSGGER